MGSVLKYVGSKNINTDKYGIMNFKTYVEPFGGSFNTGFKLLEQGFDGTLVYNDKDAELINFWEMLKKSPDKLYNICDILIKQTDISYIDNCRKSNDDLKRAAAYYVYREKFTLRGIKFKTKLNNMLEYDFAIASEMLKKIVILNLDYYNIMQVYDDKSTFMFIDPPYIVTNSNKYYTYGTDELNHIDLAKITQNLESKWLLTYNDCEYIRKLYNKQYITSVPSKFNSKYSELFITNMEVG